MLFSLPQAECRSLRPKRYPSFSYHLLDINRIFPTKFWILECQTNSLSSFSKGCKAVKQMNGNNKDSAPGASETQSSTPAWCCWVSPGWSSIRINPWTQHSQDPALPTLTFQSPRKEGDPLQFSGIRTQHCTHMVSVACFLAFALCLPFLF